MISLVFGTSVDSICSGLLRLMERLNKLSIKHSEEARRKSELADRIMDEVQSLNEEATRAGRVADKVKALLE